MLLCWVFYCGIYWNYVSDLKRYLFQFCFSLAQYPRGIFVHFTLKNNKNIFGKIRERVMLAEKNEWFI